MLLNLEDISKLYAERVIFTGVHVKIEEGDRIGLVGMNGAGKSTLLHILEGTLDFEQGTRSVKQGLAIGFLKQDSGICGQHTIYEELRSVFSELLDAGARMTEIEQQMTVLQDETDLTYRALAAEYTRLQAYFETNEGYQIDIKIKTIMAGMGFAEKAMDTCCATLSGGEKTRLALAKLLLQGTDLLMLDEPTNHLDFQTLNWLESFLQGYKGAIVVVSHDRYFLDKLCNRIWDVGNLHVTPYKGNYTKFVNTRALLYERQKKEYEMQQQEIVKLTDYIARNKVRASTAAMAKSKEKELEKIAAVSKSPPKPLHPVKMSFRFEQDPVKDVLTVEGLSLYASANTDVPLMPTALDFAVTRGEKIALVGANGIGKSSLLKMLLGKIPIRNGRIQWGKHVKLSYFEQEQVELDGRNRVIDEIWKRYPQTYERDIRNVLGGLLFRGDDVFKKVSQLSGGERARLKFAIMTYEGGNVLLLDEPTNHLDLDTKDALQKALAAYEGTIIMVSHDRYLLAEVPSKIVELEPGGLVSYAGNFAFYEQQKQVAAVDTTAVKPQRTEEKSTSTEYHRSKKQRAQQVADKKRLGMLEQEISDMELAIAQKQVQLSDPAVSGDYEQLQLVCTELEQLRSTLSSLMDEWAELSQRMEEQ